MFTDTVQLKIVYKAPYCTATNKDLGFMKIYKNNSIISTARAYEYFISRYE